jgi:GDP/UDP-N,N'-diacetylbacillosamine 2-epimerase (hydrolysing)
MRLLFLLGSRGEWGYIRPVIKEALRRGNDVQICATNMTLLPSHGSLIDMVETEGFSIDYRLLTSLEGGSRHAMAKSVGILQMGFVDVLSQSRPDWVVLAGDRAEQLAAATACAYTYTPTSHIQAGERSGNIDGVARHAIARLVHLHFASNRDAAERLIRSGEEDWRVHVTGAPQLDELLSERLPGLNDREYQRVRPSGEFLLGCLHPVTEEIDSIEMQVRATLEMLNSQPLPVVWILPNNDAGGQVVRSLILSNLRGIDCSFANLPRPLYLALLRDAAAIVGNSSSGLLEAPSFGTPAVNVGRRQMDRVKGGNVIDAPSGQPSEIHSALLQAMRPEFRTRLRQIQNPYGDGRSSPRILNALEGTARDDRLLVKRIAY